MSLPDLPGYQPHLSPNIPQVINNKDYQEFRSVLKPINTNLVNGKIEEEFVSLCLERKQKELLELTKEQVSESSEAKDNASVKLSRRRMKNL